jgi:hypothetical protein
MKSSSLLQERLAGAASLIYCLYQAQDLGHAWTSSPFDRAGSMAFLLWALPILYKAWSGRSMRMTWFAAGVILSLLGSLGDLNAVKYGGLAVTACGFLPVLRVTWIHLAAAACWMPLLGWLLGFTGPAAVNGMRVALALGSALITLRPPAFLR